MSIDFKSRKLESFEVFVQFQSKPMSPLFHNYLLTGVYRDCDAKERIFISIKRFLYSIFFLLETTCVAGKAHFNLFY